MIRREMPSMSSLQTCMSVISEEGSSFDTETSTTRDNANMSSETQKPVKEETRKNGNRIFPQMLAGFSANFALVTTGMIFGWPTPSLPRLQSKDSDLYLTSSEGAWVVSSMLMGACLGPVISALFVNRIGRKWFLYMTAVPYLCCWLLIYFAHSFEWLFIARFIGGVGVGGAYSTVPIYLGEIAETRIRGALGTMSTLMVSGGSLISYSFGSWVSRKCLALIGIAPTMLFLLTFIWMPDTPYYHLKKKSVESANKSLMWLRGTTSVQEELKEMSSLIEAEQKHRGKITDLITVPANRRASLIIMILLSAQQFSGLIALMSYMSLIFERTEFGNVAYLAVIITGVVGFGTNLITTCIVDKVGRKPLLLVSSCSACLCLCMIATFFYLEKKNLDSSFVTWLPFIGVIGMFICFGLGLGPIPYAVLSEIYPTTVKAWATMFASIFGSILGVIVSKGYQVIADDWGHHVILYGFAVCELLFVVLIVLVVPETKGKSLKEIQENLHRITKSESTLEC